MEAYIGTIMAVGFNFAPRGWAMCNGQTMSISQNTALFSLLGTTYGGDGQTTFRLPDLRGRVGVGQGAGPGLENVVMGELGGASSGQMNATGNVTVTLGANNLPPHTHGASFTPGPAAPVTVSANVSTKDGTSSRAEAGMYIGAVKAGLASPPSLYTNAGPMVALNSATMTASGGGISSGTVTVDPTGSGQSLVAPVNLQGQVPVMQPFLGMNFIICVNGIYPSRD
jgi:microcystin-dependent protein